MNGELLALGVIPARADSTRFPLKILAPIAGKTLVQHVWEAAKRCRLLSDVVVATDSDKIIEVVNSFGGNAVMTPSECPSGSDRVAIVAKTASASIIVNLQGDEPLLSAEAVDELVNTLRSEPQWGMATLVVRKQSEQELNDSNVVKAVFDEKGRALYFSRCPLAWDRENRFYKHIGIYAYRRETLLQLCEWEPSALERSERLEQLRALEHGVAIKVIPVSGDTIAVDVPADIARVENYLKSKNPSSSFSQDGTKR